MAAVSASGKTNIPKKARKALTGKNKGKRAVRLEWTVVGDMAIVCRHRRSSVRKVVEEVLGLLKEIYAERSARDNDL